MNRTANIYEYQRAKGIVVSGDIHGNFRTLVYKTCCQIQLTDTLIVVAGDCGFGFERPENYEHIYRRCREKLQKANNWVVFVRGNHDNPAYFDGIQVSHKRWLAVPDYSILKACGHTILCVGGAISIDRSWRWHENVIDLGIGKLNPTVYWLDESLVYDEAKLDAIDKSCSITAVISHTSPSFCEKQSYQDIQGWIVKDENLLDDIKVERMVMDNILAYLNAHHHPLDCWYYGHFHQSWHQEINGVKYNMLDCLEIRELR